MPMAKRQRRSSSASVETITDSITARIRLTVLSCMFMLGAMMDLKCSRFCDFIGRLKKKVLSRGVGGC